MSPTKMPEERNPAAGTGTPGPAREQPPESPAPDGRVYEISFDEDFVPPEEMDLETFLEEVPPAGCHGRFYRAAVERFCGRRRGCDPELQRELLERAIGLDNATQRYRFYRMGVKLFGPEFAEAAREDDAKTIRDWAHRTLSPAQGELF